jgi:hypothetical protein
VKKARHAGHRRAGSLLTRVVTSSCHGRPIKGKRRVVVPARSQLHCETTPFILRPRSQGD